MVQALRAMLQREKGRDALSSDRKNRSRVSVLQACADALLPALPELAAEEARLGRPLCAASYETSGDEGDMEKVPYFRHHEFLAMTMPRPPTISRCFLDI